MAEDGGGEFYIGYQETSPRGLARHTRGIAGVLLIMAALLGLLLAAAQASFAPSVFEFGNPRPFEGVLGELPYPTLEVPRPGRTGAAAPGSHFLLVDPGKHGANLPVLLVGRSVRLEGTLAYRDGGALLEVVPESLQEAGPAPSGGPAAGYRHLGTHTLAGEIVDSKCYLGVMNPAEGKTHRACAARCIAGGIPPMLVVREAGGETVRLLLASASGKPVNRRVLDLVGEPVEIRGQVIAQGDLLVLRADPASFRRLAADAPRDEG